MHPLRLITAFIRQRPASNGAAQRTQHVRNQHDRAVGKMPQRRVSAGTQRLSVKQFMLSARYVDVCSRRMSQRDADDDRRAQASAMKRGSKAPIFATTAAKPPLPRDRRHGTATATSSHAIDKIAGAGMLFAFDFACRYFPSVRAAEE